MRKQTSETAEIVRLKNDHKWIVDSMLVVLSHIGMYMHAEE